MRCTNRRILYFTLLSQTEAALFVAFMNRATIADCAIC